MAKVIPRTSQSMRRNNGGTIMGTGLMAGAFGAGALPFCGLFGLFLSLLMGQHGFSGQKGDILERETLRFVHSKVTPDRLFWAARKLSAAYAA